MTARRLALLALAALLATGGAFWLSSQRQLDRATQAGDLLLPPLREALNDVTEIRISRGDGALATLQRGEGGWTVLERSYPADAGKVRKLLLDLAALEIVEEKTHDPARYPVLGVEDVDTASATGTRIDLKAGDRPLPGVILGKTASAREVYARVATAAPSHLATPQVTADASPARWLETGLLDLDPTRIRAVTTGSPGRPARTLEGAQLPAALAGALRGLALDDTRVRALEPPGSPASPVQRARFTTWDGLVIDIEGRQDGTRRWIALSAKADPTAARPRPAPGQDPAPPETPVAAAPGEASGSGLDAAAEASRLARLAAGREFEIPAYRFATLFDPAGPGS